MPANNNNPYWNDNIRTLSLLLGIWFVVSFLLSIVFVDSLDRIRIGGFPLGFWMAQQGSIFIYVVLVFVYIRLMDRLDRKHRVREPGWPGAGSDGPSDQGDGEQKGDAQ